ncbi:centrosome-associated protein CEP250 [Pectinophora gossypiella]|uniref:centrosome-associated protein CEP250 n=1 Tax=Pectinophora gossypiella TaxID=13191 RepID=UPI00214EA25A|nr:centrosome-associated protein CEP250 [Pectinophora gossypiella]
MYDKDVVGVRKRERVLRTATVGNKRTHSASPLSQPPRGVKKSVDNVTIPSVSASSPETHEPQGFPQALAEDKDLTMPHCMVIKMQRALATKKREFIKMRKNLISQQKVVLEAFASLRDMEARAGVAADESVGDVHIVSVSAWPAHDLLLLVRDDLEFPMHSEISGAFAPQVLQQLHSQLSPVPEEVVSLGAEMMARRIDLLNILRGKHRADRTYVNNINNMEWKTKNSEMDHETERLHRLVAGTAENLKAKINYSLELAKIPWLDREALTKRIERLQKENMILQHKIDEMGKSHNVEYCMASKDGMAMPGTPSDTGAASHQNVLEELSKERAAREALKELVSAAESMLRVARARIATLERQLKDTKAELDAARRKHKDLEQLYRHRETSYDARSKKLIEVSKTGEMTIEALSRQRDALELRVKELREQAEMAEKLADSREAEQRSRAESLQAKVADQEKRKEAAEIRVMELEARVKELEEVIHNLRERSGRLVDMERRRCLEYVPSKENEPSDRETEIWKELQVTRLALSRAEEELRQSRADKDSLLDSLSRIAQDGGENMQDKMATELLNKEQRIAKLQQVIEELRENEKLMEQSMTQYENQLASLRLEVKRLRNYDCYTKEMPFQELQTELLELHMQVEALTRERSALVTAAATRALMLERHERAADLFSRVTRARRELAAMLEGHTDPPPISEISHAEVSRSLSSVCTSSAETWTALRAERARVLRLESAVLAQSLQLEREGRVRTQLERRRAILEREILRSHAVPTSEPTRNAMIKNPSLIQDIFCFR